MLVPTILEHSPYSTIGTQSTQYNNDYNDSQSLQLPKLESKPAPMVAQAEENEASEMTSIITMYPIINFLF